jgi:hypothetical protein
MGRRPRSDRLIDFQAHGYRFALAQSTIDALPRAADFVTHLLTAGRVTPAIAREYGRLAAKAARAGTIRTPRLIDQRMTSSAVNAYWKWFVPQYDAKIRALIAACVSRNDTHSAMELRNHGPQLRAGSLVPPAPDKTIPRLDFQATNAAFNAATAEIVAAGPPPPGPPRWSDVSKYEPVSTTISPYSVWLDEPCPHWTLHIPPRPDFPVHTDPCKECRCLILDDELLNLVADGYRWAWGERPLASLPPDAFLFGAPPLGGDYVVQMAETDTAGRVAVLAKPWSPLAQEAERLAGTVTADLAVFCDRLRSSPHDAVIIDLHLATSAVLEAIKEAIGSRL